MLKLATHDSVDVGIEGESHKRLFILEQEPACTLPITSYYLVEARNVSSLGREAARRRHKEENCREGMIRNVRISAESMTMFAKLLKSRPPTSYRT